MLLLSLFYRRGTDVANDQAAHLKPQRKFVAEPGMASGYSSFPRILGLDQPW